MLRAISARIGRYLKSIPGAGVAEDEAVVAAAAAATDEAADVKDVAAITEGGDKRLPSMASMSATRPTTLVTKTLAAWGGKVVTTFSNNANATGRAAAGAADAEVAGMAGAEDIMTADAGVGTTTIATFSNRTLSVEAATTTITRIAAR